VRAAANIRPPASGWDNPQKVDARKRHLVVDCLGLVLAVPRRGAGFTVHVALSNVLAVGDTDWRHPAADGVRAVPTTGDVWQALTWGSADLAASGRNIALYTGRARRFLTECLAKRRAGHESTRLPQQQRAINSTACTGTCARLPAEGSGLE